MKRIALRAAAGLLIALTGLGAFAYMRGRARAERVYDFAVPVVSRTTDEATLARGAHLSRAVAGCAGCHGADLGGQVLSDDAVMTVVAPNLTRGRGGLSARYGWDDHVRAITRGVDPRGRPLLIMPSSVLAGLSDEDIRAIVAFVSSAPPVHRVLPASRVSPLGLILLGALDLPLYEAELIDAPPARREETPRGVSVAHGDYLVALCKGCHGPDLRGGIANGPGAPPSADISPRAMSRYTHAQFVAVLREGRRPDGTQVADDMPWSSLKSMSDEEIDSIWLSLRATR